MHIKHPKANPAPKEVSIKSIYQTDIHDLQLLKRGKVRDVYCVDQNLLLIVTTDRVSAWNMTLGTTIREKGYFLNSLSKFWFNKTQNIMPNHLRNRELTNILNSIPNGLSINDRSILVKKCEPLPIEAIVRGYIAGTAWKSYKENGTCNSIKLPTGLQYGQKLTNPIFTPSTKATVNQDDVNIDFEETVKMIGKNLAVKIRDTSLMLYQKAAKHALKRGIIIADTKFEFGIDNRGELMLIDEILTPDSSRFWIVNDYKIGQNPKSLDKEEIREYLKAIRWNKKLPAPNLPEELLIKTARKYQKAMELLTSPT